MRDAAAEGSTCGPGRGLWTVRGRRAPRMSEMPFSSVAACGHRIGDVSAFAALLMASAYTESKSYLSCVLAPSGSRSAVHLEAWPKWPLFAKRSRSMQWIFA
jgi:hypothetical protein